MLIMIVFNLYKFKADKNVYPFILHYKEKISKPLVMSEKSTMLLIIISLQAPTI